MKIKIVIGTLLFIIYYLLFASSAFAQFPNPRSNYLNTNLDVPQNFHTYTQTVLIELASAISCQLSGINPINLNSKCLGVDPKTQKIGFVEGGGGAIGVVGSLISMTFYVPVSTHDYGSYLASSFGITKKTYAANTVPPGANAKPGPTADTGVGFRTLLPTLKLWQTFRNVTYIIFVILFIIIGLGIMFRIRIDPRTVMTIQNQIPKIIIALVLVTFSYAIAGFLVDLMYVFMYLIISLIATTGIDPTDAFASNPFGAVGGLGGIGGIAWGVTKSISGIVVSIFDGTIGKVIGAVVGTIIGQFAGGPIGGLAGTFTGVPVIGTLAGSTIGKFAGPLLGGVGGFFGANYIVGFIAGFITYIIIIIAIFSALLRLWFQLIKAYIYILVMVVFSPFYIAFGLIPGRSGFGNWIRGIVANLSVFPATITMFLLGKVFINGFTKGDPGTAPFIPPLTGVPEPSSFAPIIGLGIILLTPEVVNIIREALKAPEFKYGAAIGRAGMVGPRTLGGVFGTVSQAMGLRYQWRFLQQSGGIWPFGKKAGQVQGPTPPGGQAP